MILQMTHRKWESCSHNYCHVFLYCFFQISVEIAISQGSATAGLDFTVTVTEIHFSAGQRVIDVPVSIIDDSLPELDETFVIR